MITTMTAPPSLGKIDYFKCKVEYAEEKTLNIC
jgi:hypothetical protein